MRFLVRPYSGEIIKRIAPLSVISNIILVIGKALTTRCIFVILHIFLKYGALNICRGFFYYFYLQTVFSHYMDSELGKSLCLAKFAFLCSVIWTEKALICPRK